MWYVASQRHIICAVNLITVHFATACWSIWEIVLAGKLGITCFVCGRKWDSFHLVIDLSLSRAARSWTICDCRRSPNWKMIVWSLERQHRSEIRSRSQNGSTRSRWWMTTPRRNSERNSNDLNGKTRFCTRLFWLHCATCILLFTTICILGCHFVPLSRLSELKSRPWRRYYRWWREIGAEKICSQQATMTSSLNACDH